MGFGEKVCGLGKFRVAGDDVKQYSSIGYVAYLDMQFEVVGTALERLLSPIADRTEGIDSFVPNVGIDIEKGHIQRGDANAKVIFDGNVSDVEQASRYLKLFLNAIEECLTGLDDAALELLTLNYRDDLEALQANSGLLAPGGRG